MALIHCHFFSEVLGLSCAMDVILPQPTMKQIGMAGAAGRGPHPVLYLLHGLSDDHTIWQRRTSIERYAAPLGLAVVMPAVDRSFYADARRGPRYGTFIAEELPALARSFFPLSARRQDNFVAGLSMGGYGAFRLALTYPDRFAAAASLSGALDVAASCRRRQQEGSREFADIFGPARAVAGSPHDLFHLARQVARARGPKPRLYQCCGTEDFLHQDNRRFRDHALKLGLDLTYAEGPGTHEWGYWDTQIQRVLAWLPLRKG
jgi:S-formylglutathione hydrolase FrmB